MIQAEKKNDSKSANIWDAFLSERKKLERRNTFKILCQSDLVRKE